MSYRDRLRAAARPVHLPTDAEGEPWLRTYQYTRPDSDGLVLVPNRPRLCVDCLDVLAPSRTLRCEPCDDLVAAKHR